MGLKLGSIVGLGLSIATGGIAPLLIGSFIDSDQSARKAERAAGRQRQVQQRIADVKSKRERSRLLSENRRKRATALQLAENQGAGSSSGAVGASSSISSSSASAISFLDQVSELGRQGNIFAQQSADALSDARVSSSIFSVGSQFATKGGAWEKLFN